MKVQSTLRQITIAAVLTALLFATPLAAAEKWLHVRVVEDDERVSVNIPLGVVARILPLINNDEMRHGMLDLDIDELEGMDLRELAAALKDAPDAEFVTVEGKDETVRVMKEDGHLVVLAEDRGSRSHEKVRVKMPLKVVDALVGDGNELDLVAALDALGEYEGEPLVDVESDDSTVRVWIDSSEAGRY